MSINYRDFAGYARSGSVVHHAKGVIIEPVAEIVGRVLLLRY